MWRRLKNIFHSFGTYADLSPDLRTRQSVNRFLRSRSCLSAEEWYEQLWGTYGVSRQIADFVYTNLSDYSGLQFARVRPGDRLDEDLHLLAVCWFDWQTTLCEDFLQCFQVDLSDRFDPQTYDTVEDLVIFLNHQLLPANYSNGQ